MYNNNNAASSLMKKTQRGRHLCACHHMDMDQCPHQSFHCSWTFQEWVQSAV